ncbi:uncharacterized protein Bfra_009727 [Botrytis fragariae]|uniref:Uncharacterized protein n=1 Tax=Botrytis fragariae TaxID=1964551 RepID=A0A8H6AN25_9HELO|nr:uncharacterized protein Bfra_009727 [Botrytis fragariae]KAF5870343.1 hypothetical protein Bfra_009727 [Botrytis fragariae]
MLLINLAISAINSLIVAAGSHRFMFAKDNKYCLESKSGAENGPGYSSFYTELSPVTAIVGGHPRNNMEQTGIVSAHADTSIRDLFQTRKIEDVSGMK